MHFIKSGIFFWYGLLTLGRWMGCCWAWNVKPSQFEIGSWKASLPTAEFNESFAIWLYGTTNVFLEHLVAWGDVWTAQELEHVSISIMFFGGGLVSLKLHVSTCNTNILLSAACLSSPNASETGQTHPYSSFRPAVTCTPKTQHPSNLHLKRTLSP